MNSRARFSLGLPTRSPLPSTAASPGRPPSPAPTPGLCWCRGVAGSLSIAILAKRSFWMLVAKRPGQNHVMRSGKGSWRGHPVRHLTTSSGAAAAAPAPRPGPCTRSTAAKAGVGGPAALRGPGAARASSVASNPAAVAVSSSPRRGPNPSRWSRRRTASRSPIGVMSPWWPDNVRAMSGIGPGLVLGAVVEGHTVGRMARAYAVLLVVALAVLGRPRARRPGGRGGRRRRTRRRWPPCRTRSTRSPRTAAPPGPRRRRTRTARGTWPRSATPHWLRRARRRRWQGGCAPGHRRAAGRRGGPVQPHRLRRGTGRGRAARPGLRRRAAEDPVRPQALRTQLAVAPRPTS